MDPNLMSHQQTVAPSRMARLAMLMQHERYRWWLVAALLTMFAGARAGSALERDPFWEARAGIENLHGAPLARLDTWSWSTHGVWYPNSPAWNAVLGQGWEWLGFWGLFWPAFLAMSALFGVALVAARALGARALPTFAAFAPLLLASSGALAARATVVVQVLVLVSALFAWWWSGRERRPAAPIDVLVVAVTGFAISFVGNWMHLSFMAMSAVVAVAWSVAWWCAPRLGLGRRIALAVAGAIGLFAGCLASPYGIGETLERSRVVSGVASGLITEWMSVGETMQLGNYRWLVVAAVAVVATAGSVWWFARVVRRHGRFDPRVRLAVQLLLVAVPAAVLGIGTIRFLYIGMLAVLPVAAGAASAAAAGLQARWGGEATAHPKLAEYVSGRFWAAALTLLAIVMLPVAVAVASVGGRPPEAALIAGLPRGCHLFSDASVAGPAILMRPDLTVWTDGRADFYGRPHIIEDYRIAYVQESVPPQADCALLPLRTEDGAPVPVVGALDSDPGWRRIVTMNGYATWGRR